MIGIAQLADAMLKGGYDSFKVEQSGGVITIYVAEHPTNLDRLELVFKSLGIRCDGVATNRAWFKNMFNPPFDFPEGDY